MKRKAVLTHAFVFALGAAVSYWLMREGGSETPPPEPAASVTFEAQREAKGRAQMTNSQGSQAIRSRAEELRRLLGKQERSELLSYFSEWTKEDASSAFETMMALDDPDERAAIAMALYESWGEVDPQEALSSLDTLNKGEFRNLSSVMLIGGWAKSQPEAAADYVEKMPSGGLRMQHVSSLLAQWAASDPLAALRWSEGLQSLSEQNEALRSVFGKWGSVDPLGAIEELSYFKNGPWKNESYSAVLRSWAANDPRGAAQHIADSQDSSRVEGAIYTSVASHYLRSDPAEAIAWMSALTDSRAQAEMVMNVMSDLTRLAPESTRTLLESMPAARTEGAWLQYANVWASQDFDAAKRWAVTLEDPAQRAQAMTGVSLRLSAESPEAAAHWVSKQDFEGSDRLLTQLLSEWGSYEPYKAYQFAATRVSSEYLEAASYQIASSLSREDPELAARWVGDLADPEVRSTLTNDVFKEWVRSDPQDARGYAEALQDPLRRKAAFEACFEHSRRYDTEGAFVWLEREGMLGIDDRQLRNAYFGWEAKAPEQARAWAERNAASLTFRID